MSAKPAFLAVDSYFIAVNPVGAALVVQPAADLPDRKDKPTAVIIRPPSPHSFFMVTPGEAIEGMNMPHLINTFIERLGPTEMEMTQYRELFLGLLMEHAALEADQEAELKSHARKCCQAIKEEIEFRRRDPAQSGHTANKRLFGRQVTEAIEQNLRPQDKREIDTLRAEVAAVHGPLVEKIVASEFVNFSLSDQELADTEEAVYRRLLDPSNTEAGKEIEFVGYGADGSRPTIYSLTLYGYFGNMLRYARAQDPEEANLLLRHVGREDFGWVIDGLANNYTKRVQSMLEVLSGRIAMVLFHTVKDRNRLSSLGQAFDEELECLSGALEALEDDQSAILRTRLASAEPPKLLRLAVQAMELGHCRRVLLGEAEHAPSCQAALLKKGEPMEWESPEALAPAR